MKEEEELEEFEEEEDLDLEEEPKPKPRFLGQQKQVQQLPANKKRVYEELVEEVSKPQPQPQKEPEVVVVPRAVSIENMFNEIYDMQQQILQILLKSK